MEVVSINHPFNFELMGLFVCLSMVQQVVVSELNIDLGAINSKLEGCLKEKKNGILIWIWKTYCSLLLLKRDQEKFDFYKTWSLIFRSFAFRS